MHPKGAERIKTAAATKCKVIITIGPERLSALARRLLSDVVLRAFPVAALSDGEHSLLWPRRFEPHKIFYLGERK